MTVSKMIFQDFLTLTPERIFTVYVMYSSISALFLIFAAKLSRRGQKSQQKAFITKVFLYIALGLIINVIYAPFNNRLFQEVGTKIVIFMTTMGFVNLLFFTYSLTRSTQEFTRKKSIIAEILFACVAGVYFFLPVSLKDPDLSPIWPTGFIIFCAIFTQALFTLAMVYGVLVERTMKDEEIRKRFRLFLLGLVLLEIVLISTLLRNGQYLAALGSVGTTLLMLLALCIIPGGILIYLGVGKNIK